MHVVITTPDSKWSLPERPIGLFPAWGLEAVVRRVGVPKARQLAWGLDVLDGTAASQWGLADLVADNPVSSATALAKRMSALPGEQRAAVKAYFAAYASVEAADIRANDLFMAATRSPEVEASFARFGESVNAHSPVPSDTLLHSGPIAPMKWLSRLSRHGFRHRKSFSA